MEAICSSETPVASQQTTRRHIPEDDTLHKHPLFALKSHLPCCYLNMVHHTKNTQNSNTFFVLTVTSTLFYTLYFQHHSHHRVLSSGIQCCVVCWESTNVFQEHIASIFRVEEKAEQETSMKAGGKQSSWFPAWLIFRPWRWRRYVPPKRWLTLNRLHSVISQYSS
jgi:hypothetical protein